MIEFQSRSERRQPTFEAGLAGQSVQRKPKTLETEALNLLKHMPGEATGLYLMGVDAVANPSLGVLAVLAAMALILLIVVRWLAGASRAVMLTTVGAFVIWMAVFDNGVINAAFPKLLPDPLGLLLAVFYSTLITILTTAGKIK